jgi:hypothetical protein
MAVWGTVEWASGKGLAINRARHLTKRSPGSYPGGIQIYEYDLPKHINTEFVANCLNRRGHTLPWAADARHVMTVLERDEGESIDGN